MNRILVVLCLNILGVQGVLAQSALAQGFPETGHGSHGTHSGFLIGPKETYLEPIRPNIYGPGVNADATGRLFQWAPRSASPSLSEGPAPWQPDGLPAFKADGALHGGPDLGGNIAPDPSLRVSPNRYGLGVHADQYGRIVQPVPWP